MNYLIADTTDKALNIVLVNGDKVYKYFNSEAVRHNSEIIPAIDNLLKQSGLNINEIDVFSAVIGPGSFTGIRIGVTVMNAFKAVTGAKLIAINTFEMISPISGGDALLLIDARNNNYYGAELKEGRISRLGNYREADLDLNLLRKVYRKNIDYSDNLIEIVNRKSSAKEYSESLAPLYLKGSQAERELAKMNYIIQPMESTHLDKVMEIEKDCFPSPWTKEMYLEILSNSDAYNPVVICGDEIIGYASILQLYDEMHIMKIAVSSQMRRQGYGDILLDKIIEHSKALSNVAVITLEVRVSNSAARALYEKFGFINIGIRKKYYEMKEDALIYTLELRR